MNFSKFLVMSPSCSREAGARSLSGICISSDESALCLLQSICFVVLTGDVRLKPTAVLVFGWLCTNVVLGLSSNYPCPCAPALFLAFSAAALLLVIFQAPAVVVSTVLGLGPGSGAGSASRPAAPVAAVLYTLPISVPSGPGTTPVVVTVVASGMTVVLLPVATAVVAASTTPVVGGLGATVTARVTPV